METIIQKGVYIAANHVSDIDEKSANSVQVTVPIKHFENGTYSKYVLQKGHALVVINKKFSRGKERETFLFIANIERYYIEKNFVRIVCNSQDGRLIHFV